MWQLYYLSILGFDFAMFSILFTIIASFYKNLTVFASIFTEVAFGLALGATLGFWFLIAIWDWNEWDPTTKFYFTIIHSFPIIFMTVNAALT
jgi:hypothetical protein